MPGKPAAEPEVVWGNEVDMGISHVSKPTLEIYPAKSGRQTQTGAVIINPGGAYQGLSYTLEGREIARWLSDAGITAAILKYRVPNNREGALMDIQRAIRLMRSKSAELKINPDKIAVMYAGRIVEYASNKELFKNPKHPYTKALLNVILDINTETVQTIEGHPPSITDDIAGCPFHPRCKDCMDICLNNIPKSRCTDNSQVACHLYD